MSWKIPVALFFLKPWLYRKKNEEKVREKRPWREREREKARRNPKIML
jgi:hypothetical protein